MDPKLAKLLYSLIDIAEGNPPGTTQPYTYTREELEAKAESMVRISNVLQWGCIAACGILYQGHGVSPSKMPNKSVRWHYYVHKVKILEAMLDSGAKIEPSKTIDEALAVFQKCGETLTTDECRVIWDIACAKQWSLSRTRDIVETIVKFKSVSSDPNYLSLVLEAAERRAGIENKHGTDAPIVVETEEPQGDANE